MDSCKCSLLKLETDYIPKRTEWHRCNADLVNKKSTSSGSLGLECKVSTRDIRELTQLRRQWQRKRGLKKKFASLKTLSRLDGPINWSNRGYFYWGWILEDFIQDRKKKENLSSYVHAIRKTSYYIIAGLPRARSARGTEPHTHGIWSTSFRLVVTWLTERTYVHTYVRVYRLYGWGREDYQKEGRGVSGVCWQVHIFNIGF